MRRNTVLFAKEFDNVIIPSKRDEDAGYDIYPYFKEDYIIIRTNETVMIPTGLYSAFHKSKVMVLHERGSTGTKGIGQRCGVIDSGYRNSWIVPITNHTNNIIVITDLSDRDLRDKMIDNGESVFNKITIYPKSKAICQALLLPVPKARIKETSLGKLKGIKSKRGIGKLGSSGK